MGCYTSNCTASGLQNIASSTGIRPFFTVCNYGPPGELRDEPFDELVSGLFCDDLLCCVARWIC